MESIPTNYNSLQATNKLPLSNMDICDEYILKDIFLQTCLNLGQKKLLSPIQYWRCYQTMLM